MQLPFFSFFCAALASPLVPTGCRVSNRQFSVSDLDIKIALYECDFDEPVFVRNFTHAPSSDSPVSWASLEGNILSPADPNGQEERVYYHITSYFAGHMGLKC